MRIMLSSTLFALSDSYEPLGGAYNTGLMEFVRSPYLAAFHPSHKIHILIRLIIPTKKSFRRLRASSSGVETPLVIASEPSSSLLAPRLLRF